MYMKCVSIKRIILNRLLLFGLCGVLAFVASAQEGRRVLMWGDREDCGFKRNIDLAKEAVKCSTITTERGRVSVIEHEGLTLGIVLAFDKANLLISVSISNSTADLIIFDPDNWATANFHSMEEFRMGKPPVFAEYSIPSRDLVRGMRNSTALGNSLDTRMADIDVVMKTVEIRRPDGTRVRVLQQAPNEEARALAQSRSENRSELTGKQQSEIRKTALLDKAIPAHSTVKGIVYFRRENKAPYSLITMPIGDTLYVIHFLHKPK